MQTTLDRITEALEDHGLRVDRLTIEYDDSVTDPCAPDWVRHYVYAATATHYREYNVDLCSDGRAIVHGIED